MIITGTLDAKLKTEARKAVRNSLRNGALAYIEHDSVRESVKLLLRADGVDEMRDALRSQQARYAAGHWSADLNKIVALKQALIAERWMRRFSTARIAQVA